MTSRKIDLALADMTAMLASCVELRAADGEMRRVDKAQELGIQQCIDILRGYGAKSHPDSNQGVDQ